MNTCANPIVRVGVDLSKHLFQVHAVDRGERVVYAKALVREKFLEWCAKLPAGCLVAVEACGGAHDVAHRLGTLGLDARLIAAHFVEPYRIQGRSGKNDANDAAAICEAASRPRTRFVPVKSVQQQGLLSIHRLREGCKADCTACINRKFGAWLGLVPSQHSTGQLSQQRFPNFVQLRHAFVDFSQVRPAAGQLDRQSVDTPR